MKNVFGRLDRIWSRRYMTLDRYMSGKFMKVFLITFAVTITCFVLLWLFSHLMKGWTAGEVFIQMTNPSPARGVMDLTEWMLIVIVNLFGMFVVNGVLLTLLINWISNRKERFENGMARYEIVGKGRFSVIIGGHSMAARLAHRIMKRDGLDYVLVQTVRSPSELRKEILSEIKDPELASNVIIYSGSRTSWHELEDLNVINSNEVYILGENHDIDGHYHDSHNLKCWDLLRGHLLEPKDRKLPCHVMFESDSIFTVLQTTDIDLDDTRTFRFIPFSNYEIWSRTVLAGQNLAVAGPEYEPLDGKDGVAYDSPFRVHLVVSGTNKQAASLVAVAAQLAHYPNFLNKKAGCPRTLLTIVDPEVKGFMHRMQGKLPHLFNLARWRYVEVSDDSFLSNHSFPWIDPLNTCSSEFPFAGGYLGEDFIDIDFEFISGSLYDPSVRRYLADACGSDGEEARLTIALCDDNPDKTLEEALSLPEVVYDKACQILVQQNSSSTVVDGIRRGKTGSDNWKYHALRPFGMLKETDYFGLFEARLPKYVAYAYDAINHGSSFEEEYRKAGGLERFNEEVDELWLGMNPDGGKTCIAQRWSNFYSANSFYSKLRSVGIDVSASISMSLDSDSLQMLARTEHNRWVMEQLLLGMAPPSKDYAEMLPIEDSALRRSLKSKGIHPDLISNDKLGSTRHYDEEIVRIIPLALRLSSIG